MTRSEFIARFPAASESVIRLSTTAEPAPPFVTAGPQAEDESALHSAIMAECARRGWQCLHGAMTRRTHRTPGEYDCVIVADRRRTFLIELKSRKGKLSPGQFALHHQARRLGHDPHVVRSLSEFVRIVDNDDIQSK